MSQWRRTYHEFRVFEFWYCAFLEISRVRSSVRKAPNLDGGKEADLRGRPELLFASLHEDECQPT